MIAACALAMALLGSLACRRQAHLFPPGSLEKTASSQAIGSGSIREIRTYMDVSASMRGFGLASTANRSAATDVFQSLLIGVDSLRDLLPTSAASQPDDQEQAAKQEAAKDKDESNDAESADHRVAPPPVRLSLFGTTVQSLSGEAALTPIALGRAPVSKPAGAVLEAGWKSRDCTEKWGGSPAVRSQIDQFFSQKTTCLHRVFEELLAAPDRSALDVVVTDAEQTGDDDSVVCPSPKNVGGIRAALYSWIHDRGGYAAVVAFRLPAFPWQAESVGSQFCGCQSRNVYVYLLGPSADVVESAYAHLARAWRGKPDAIAYLPLGTRPVSQFDVEMAVEKPQGKNVALVPTQAPKHLLEPETAVLPVFWLDLTKVEEAAVHFKVRNAHFESPVLANVVGRAAIDWSRATYEWPDEPMSLQGPPADRSAQGATRTAAARAPRDSDGVLEIVRPMQTTDRAGGSVKRIGHFHAESAILSSGEGGIDLPEVTYLLRKTRLGAHGCNVYLVQLNGEASEIVDRAWNGLSFVRNSIAPCSDIGPLRDQSRHVTRSAPALRFLLHVDY